MFIGHFDLANTAVAPLDFVNYPYSHSLLMLVVWGVILGWLSRTLSGDRRAFVVIAALWLFALTGGIVILARSWWADGHRDAA